MSDATSDEQTGDQQHSIGIYLKAWLLLFVFSVFSYMVDYYDLQGYLRWSLILFFMVLKAGFIIYIFMHFAWERMALKLLITVPTVVIFIFIALMAIEADYIYLNRLAFFSFGD
ncbi:cytochrome C oxidase subunit IV family protein [Marinimicrobium sp. ABcell2]|uniref:cytochrome C oxidase subunit IV family protein n=1 Tax=Marinimicrobium sp. ABcell2 TaxID=3069751 RepID=UPI0027B227BB|nr:cytochrome C oxidase subunit IV family protein [Marinimicrobium sp. ABcell2]MDQ2078483.1 cytochrome C oxidase subunit IV family protein [Marinimicrobium sp. ABcell2]